MSTRLFDDFPPIPSKQWKQKIQFDLKGADYNDALVWTSNEGIQVKPFYHSDDIANLPKVPPNKTKTFKICETIFVSDTVIANKLALKVLNSGSESIKFILPNKDISLKDVLHDINLEETPIYFDTHFLSEAYLKNLSNVFEEAKLYTNTDIIGNLAKTGNWFYNLNDDFSKFAACVKHSNSFSIHSALYQNAGANMVQQLAYTLAHANEYFNYLENSITNKIKLDLVLNVAVGSNYFFEIAKLRALRLLFNTVQQEYTIDYNINIFASPSKRNKAIYDYNTNMLRTTTECMSAVLGGADLINNLAYDIAFHKDNDFGRRIARNQLLILKHESYFNMVNNPADGSYYIETLTEQLTEKALIVFKDIEANGGFLKQLKNGTIQRKIKESASKEQSKFNNGEEVILGSNKYPNPNDKMKNDLEIYPFVKIEKRKTLIEPIIEKRLTENLEQERLKKE